jgi:hypothetical protein
MHENGVRYYRSSPYLLIESQGTSYKWRIIYLPDQTQKMVAYPFQLLAKIDSSLTFDKGVLTVSTDTVTADAVPKAIVEAAEKAAALLMRNRKPEPAPVVAPRLYKIRVVANRIVFFGGPGEEPLILPNG